MQFFDQMPPCVFPVVNATIYNVTKVECSMRPYKQDCRPDAGENFSLLDLFFISIVFLIVHRISIFFDHIIFR